MENFLKKIVDWEKFELLVDSEMFDKNIVLKAVYGFLDKGYFFLKFDTDKNIIVQFTRKNWILENLENIIFNFSDSLIETYLRDRLEKENKVIRETIVEKAMNWPLDFNNFISLDTGNSDNWESRSNNMSNQIDFDKDIEEILKEIENDPDLKMDEEEIEKILKEIEQEPVDKKKPILKMNKEGIQRAKDKFKK